MQVTAKHRHKPKPLQELALGIRRNALAMIYRAGSGHPGGALSCADLLAWLVQEELRWGEVDLNDPRRDRLILSKGHACPALYGAAAECGVIDRDMQSGFRKLGSPLQGHTHVLALPWTETSTGSLGQGFSVAIGMAMGLKHLRNDAHVFAILGDGELQEGEVWEGAMCASHHHLGHLCAIIDYNKLQSDDSNENIMALEPLADKWRAFGWRVREIDGHDFGEIAGAFDWAHVEHGQPAVIIAHTIKGKGVSYMENSPLWHGSVKLRDEDLEQALRDLGTSEPDIAAYREGTKWPA